MSKQKRTPGKWQVSKHGVPDGIYQAGIYAEGSQNDLAIVVTSKADADLIAASPELYESLKEILAITDRKHNAWERAYAAIASAEGA